MKEGLSRPAFRFAPSPNGRLHLGHAYSALLNARLPAEIDARFLLRIEDIDRARSKPEYERAIVADLAWIGLAFAETPRRQSEHAPDYAGALERLDARGLVYPCFCTRGEIARAGVGRCDPDGAPLYSGACRRLGARERAARLAQGRSAATRLDMGRALAFVPAELHWREYGEGSLETQPLALPAAWGDFVLKRKDMPASYHLAVVVDDWLQGVSDVVRGRDLFHATSAHRLLQELLGFAPPRYRHHRLVRDANGLKMAKSGSSTSLEALRESGISASEIRAALGFGDSSEAAPLAVTIS